MRFPCIKLFFFVTEAPAKFKKECFPLKPFQPSPIFVGKTGGLYYKHMTIVNDDSSVIGKWSPKRIDDTRVVICDQNMFIIQATEVGLLNI
jgi:hypothetical protein